MLYHVSQTKDLKVLAPHLSTHGKAYVYAIESKATALLFGAEKDDFDINTIQIYFDIFHKNMLAYSR